MALVEFGNSGPMAAVDDIVDHLVTSEELRMWKVKLIIFSQCLWHMPLSPL